jgi:hypothetical protein
VGEVVDVREHADRQIDRDHQQERHQRRRLSVSDIQSKMMP